jgi:hypothetical protein
MGKQIYFWTYRRVAFLLWLVGYRLYVFPGDVFYYLYYRFLDLFWPCFDLIWAFRIIRQEKRIEEIRQEFLSFPPAEAWYSSHHL